MFTDVMLQSGDGSSEVSPVLRPLFSEDIDSFEPSEDVFAIDGEFVPMF